MIDFVVSKVAMSICALLAVSVLAGVFDDSHFLDTASELRVALRDLCGLVDRGIRAAAEADIEWTVPFLSDGTDIMITITSGVVRGEAGERRDAQQTTTPLHLWQYSGQTLNTTQVRQLDQEAQDLTVDSGQTVMISILSVLCNNQRALFAFAAA